MTPIPGETIIPPWYGERLDLDYAIHACFANAANQASGPPPIQVHQSDEADQLIRSAAGTGGCCGTGPSSISR